MSNYTDDLSKIEVGQRVCVVGRGTSNIVHYHGKVSELTKTMIKVEHKVREQSLVTRFSRRHGYDLPYSEWGGSTLYFTCQRPKS